MSYHLKLSSIIHLPFFSLMTLAMSQLLPTEESNVVYLKLCMKLIDWSLRPFY